MHRSITLSEIASSTFLDNAEDTTVIEQSKKQKFAAQLGIGLIEFLVCSLYQCYGILLAELIQSGDCSIGKGIWTTLIFASTWHISGPWSRILRKYLEKKKYFHYKIVLIIYALFLSVGIVIPPHYIFYGVFGGIFSNLIYTQLKYIARKKIKTTEKSFEGNILSARAISLLIMPHIMLLLVSNFPLNRVTMLYSAIILNIIPAVLIIKLPRQDLEEIPFSGTINRYHTLPAFSQQVKEMKIFSTSGNISDLDYNDKTNDFEPKDDEDSDEDFIDEDDDLVHEKYMKHNENSQGELPQVISQLTPNTVQAYYSLAGVSILPGIPEEEELQEEKNINVIDLKRLSKISITLEELNSREKKEIVMKETVVPKEILIKPEPIRNIEYISNYSEKTFIKDKILRKRKSCCSCSPYSLFIWKRRGRLWKDCLIDYLFKPIFKSLTDLHFYPTLFSKLAINMSSVFFISLVPYVTLQKNDGYKIEDMAFLLSYTAFSWCLSLIFLPLLITFSTVKLRITFIVGLVLSSCSMLLLTKRKMTNDFIIWSSLLFGFGYGLIKFCEQFVYKAFTGKRRYAQLEWTLSTSTGLFVILIYYVVYINNIDLVAWFPIISFISYFINAILWVVLPVMKDVLIFLKKYFLRENIVDNYMEP